MHTSQARRAARRSAGLGSLALAARIALVAGAAATAQQALANEELVRLAKDDKQWVMQGKDYDHSHYSGLTQINRSNVKNLKAAWTFSTGVLHGHEGGPLVVGGIMYVHTPFPNTTYAIDLNNPNKILWEHKPKQDASVRAVACCDVVNRGLAYGDGKIFKTQLDGHVVALDAKTGKEIWKMENSDPKVGSTLTQAPIVVEDLVVVGSSGAELGVRGYLTAYRMKDGQQVWRAYATGPDSDLLLADDFNAPNPHYGQKGLGTSTWEGDAWKIGGGTNWGWYAYDAQLKQLYYGSGNPAPWNETMRPGDNKWTMSIWSRDAKTGKAKFAFQKTPHDEWDYAGVNWIGLSEQVVDGKKQKLLTHPDRNGIIYTLNRENGNLVRADKMDPTVNVFKGYDMKKGVPIRDPEYSTRMDHLAKGICPSAMGYHNQGHDSIDKKRNLVMLGTNMICMDWEPFMLPYRAGQFFVGATLNMYATPGNNNNMGQVKAYDVATSKFKWSKDEKFSVWGGTTSTAGDLVFHGTLDGFIKARDADTGEVLWQFKLPSGVIGHPVTYEHKGKQYVAIYYGVGGWPGVGLVFDLTDPTAGLGAVGAFKELQQYTKMGGGMMVFSL